MEIQYYEKAGRIFFIAQDTIWLPYTDDEGRTSLTIEVSVQIPAGIIAHGEKAIRSYATAWAERKLEKEKARLLEEHEFEANPNLPVSVEYPGIILKGRIVSAQNQYLQVQLEEPYQGQIRVRFGYGSAMAGHQLFKGHCQLSEYALEVAQKLLIQIYEEKTYEGKYGETIELVQRLNQ